MSGQTSYLAGLAAEECVAALYQDNGYHLHATRWRCPEGEIDLIFQRDEVFVFVEVKKSRSFAQAAHRMRPKQQQRIWATASVFLAEQTAGQNSACRFDLALVAGDGAVHILENISFDF